jgi:hypothetical protein
MLRDFVHDCNVFNMTICTKVLDFTNLLSILLIQSALTQEALIWSLMHCDAEALGEPIAKPVSIGFAFLFHNLPHHRTYFIIAAFAVTQRG